MGSKKLFYVLAFVVIIFLLFVPDSEEVNFAGTDNIIVEDNVIDFDSMTLRQKIAQMIVIRGDEGDFEFNELNVGGIFLDRQESALGYQDLIDEFWNSSKIRLFVSTDLEGAWTPFRESDYDFPYFSDISSKEEAYEIGKKHGEVLKEIGFNLNFAPVAEYSDFAYGGRVFLGSEEEVKGKVEFYITGLQENVWGTCKHYPGRAMEANLHEVSYEVNVSPEDLELFDVCFENNVFAVMVGHQVISGVVDSFGKPASVSEEVISGINEDFLIVSDEVNMDGLSEFYSSKVDMYVELINAGENLILDFDLDVKELSDLVEDLSLREDLDLEKVDKSVLKILERKGYDIRK